MLLPVCVACCFFLSVLCWFLISGFFGLFVTLNPYVVVRLFLLLWDCRA